MYESTYSATYFMDKECLEIGGNILNYRYPKIVVDIKELI